MPAEFLYNLPKNLTTHLTHKLYAVFPLQYYYIITKNIFIITWFFRSVNRISRVKRKNLSTYHIKNAKNPKIPENRLHSLRISIIIEKNCVSAIKAMSVQD